MHILICATCVCLYIYTHVLNDYNMFDVSLYVCIFFPCTFCIYFVHVCSCVVLCANYTFQMYTDNTEYMYITFITYTNTYTFT